MARLNDEQLMMRARVAAHPAHDCTDQETRPNCPICEAQRQIHAEGRACLWNPDDEYLPGMAERVAADLIKGFQS
jgi:hypothetical protein